MLDVNKLTAPLRAVVLPCLVALFVLPGCSAGQGAPDDREESARIEAATESYARTAIEALGGTYSDASVDFGECAGLLGDRGMRSASVTWWEEDVDVAALDIRMNDLPDKIDVEGFADIDLGNGDDSSRRMEFYPKVEGRTVAVVVQLFERGEVWVDVRSLC